MRDRLFLFRSRSRLLDIFSRSRSLLRAGYFLGLRALLIDVNATSKVTRKLDERVNTARSVTR